MRSSTTAIGVALVLIGLGGAPGAASAQSLPGAGLARPSVSQSTATEISAQRRNARRPPTRLRVYPIYRPEPYGVYPRYNPGPNAVRDCTASYVEEYRPSGTVITPRMNCFWRRG